MGAIRCGTRMVMEFAKKRQQGGQPQMGYEAKKTEHCGPKRGEGAYWGYKWEAKKESNRIRRENWKREIRNALADRGARTETDECQAGRARVS